MGKSLACSEFVKRQTPESGYSHFSGTWEELESITLSYMFNPLHVKQGYKDGVILVSVPAQVQNPFGGWQFYSGTVEINEKTKLVSHYAPRVLGEAPYIRTSAKAKKQLANYVEIICYRWDVLAADNDRSSDASWEIICIKARVSDEEEPMDPYTMARNFLHMKGGTKGDFTAEQFAKSIVYWNNHCMCAGNHSILNRIKTYICNFFKKC